MSLDGSALSRRTPAPGMRFQRRTPGAPGAKLVTLYLDQVRPGRREKHLDVAVLFNFPSAGGRYPVSKEWVFLLPTHPPLFFQNLPRVPIGAPTESLMPP